MIQYDSIWFNRTCKKNTRRRVTNLDAACSVWCYGYSVIAQNHCSRYLCNLVQHYVSINMNKYVSDVIGQTWGVWDAGFHEVLWWRVCAHSEGQAAAAWALQISAAESHSKRSQRSQQKEDLFCVFPRPVVHWFGQGKLDGTTDCP